jgi:hypothetical protein
MNTLFSQRKKHYHENIHTKSKNITIYIYVFLHRVFSPISHIPNAHLFREWRVEERRRNNNKRKKEAKYTIQKHY